MLPSFSYVRPGSLGEAARHLAAPRARIHAGGTDLLGCLRDRVFGADVLVSLSGLSELRGISERPDGSLRIGALATLAEIAAHAAVRERWTALAEGAAAVATPQIRNQATLGGNLCQRPRCWYFRGDFACARKGGDTCFAMAGENELHAILGGSGCYMVHPSDAAAPLVALGARARIVGPSGPRSVPFESFFVPPSDDLTRETVLRVDEILTDVILPPVAGGARSRYGKVRLRASWDFALAGVAVVVEQTRGVVSRARVVLSGVAPIPWRCAAAEAALVGQPLDASAAAAAGRAAVQGAEPLEENEYKVALARGIVEATLLDLAWGS